MDARMLHDGAHDGGLIGAAHDDQHHFLFSRDGHPKKALGQFARRALGVHDGAAARARASRGLHHQVGPAAFRHGYDQRAWKFLLFHITHLAHNVVLVFHQRL